jgi:hypothetical protein
MWVRSLIYLFNQNWRVSSNETVFVFLNMNGGEKDYLKIHCHTNKSGQCAHKENAKKIVFSIWICLCWTSQEFSSWLGMNL